MVSQRAGRRSAAGSRARLLAAAAQEFAARGFDGAKVHRITARAGINKAMLYYHFQNKAALYREILRDVFGAVAGAVEAERRRGGTPDAQLRAFVAAVADGAITRPHFPVIWLREIADAGRHLDEAIVGEMRRVLYTLAAILDDGRRAGCFREVHPFIAQMGIVAPLLFFAASEPVRMRFQAAPQRRRARSPAIPVANIPRELVIEHVQQATLAALLVNPPRRNR